MERKTETTGRGILSSTELVSLEWFDVVSLMSSELGLASLTDVMFQGLIVSWSRETFATGYSESAFDSRLELLAIQVFKEKLCLKCDGGE